MSRFGFASQSGSDDRDEVENFAENNGRPSSRSTDFKAEYPLLCWMALKPESRIPLEGVVKRSPDEMDRRETGKR